jgi:hypothetical protein
MYLILSSSMPVTLYGETFSSLQSGLRSMPFSMLLSSFLEIDPYGSFLFVDNAGLLHTGEWRLGKSYTWEAASGGEAKIGPSNSQGARPGMAGHVVWPGFSLFYYSQLYLATSLPSSINKYLGFRVLI